MIITVMMTIMVDDIIARTPTPTAQRRWVGLIAVLLGQFMLVLDATVVNVALPVIQADLHLPGARLTWVTNASAGPTPAVQARSSARPLTASSWRTCPKVNDLRNVPSVDGAITRCPSTEAVDPARNMSA